MEITDIKQQLTITAVLAHYQLTANKSDMLCCPFHADKTPSLQIYPKTNTYCCFSGNCEAGTGDVIDFIQRKDKSTKYEALNKAKSLLGHVNGTTETNSLSQPSLGGQTLSRMAVLTKFYDSSLQAIGKSTPAKNHASARNLDWKTLKIGFAGNRLQNKWNEPYKQQAAQVGLIKKVGNSYAHHFNNCLLFPLVNAQGKIVSLYGRSISDKRHIYLKGGHQGLYPKYPSREARHLIITESIIDAATLLNHLPDAQYTILALYGTNGFTKEHTEAIKSLQDLQEIILFLDGDEAGCKATTKYAVQLATMDCKLSTVDCPEGEDINSLAINHQGEEKELFTHLLNTRKPITNQRSTDQLNTNQPINQSPNPNQLNTTNPELLYYATDTLHITILGGIKITGLDRLRVTLKIEAITAARLLPIRHSLDLYNSKQIGELVRQISEQYELSEIEIQHTLATLTTNLETYRNTRLEAMKPKKPTKKTLTQAEEKEALDYLKDNNLLVNTLKDIKKSGIIGEERNAMITFLAYLSRKREKPLHIMCLGVSGSGKTYLQEKIGELVPEEDKLEITMLSENAFYYFGKEELKHKLLLIEDLDGAENVLYPLRELQSKRRISKTVTLKDNKGNLKTMTLEVEGPVCVSSCTTRENIYEDNANRCILLYIDTSKVQDKRITNYQRSESAGQINRTVESAIKEKFKNIQRLLKPIKVVNPYAQYIDLPEEVFKPRRTMILLLSFIETITFYHQAQRPIKTTETHGRTIESTVEDVEKGFNLLREVLFSKSDELSGACRNFLETLKKTVNPAEPFYKKEIREKLRINPNTLKRHLRELMNYGYLQVTGGNRHRGYQYQLVNEQEYQQLKGKIDQQLDEIIQKIKAASK